MVDIIAQSIASYFGLVVGLILGLIGLRILARDREMRRELQREELDFRREKFEEERAERKQRRDWLDRERIRLRQIGKPLSENIATQLAEDPHWAVEALRAAKLGPRATTLFGARSGHFREEKERLADLFLPLLLRRCRRHIECGAEVYLLLDSGTTIFPLFGRLGREAFRCHQNDESWIENLTVVTNNLPGVEKLMETGRINPNSRYSRLALKCELLPGAPLPIYSAVTGHRANKGIQVIRSEASEKSVFISIITGNWVRLRSEAPTLPVPLARGEGHVDLKSTLIKHSDEIFVTTPLGKIFVKDNTETINRALGFNQSHTDPERHPYLDVPIDDGKAASIKMVSTCRSGGFLLANHSVFVKDHLGADWWSDQRGDEFVNSDSEEIPHLLFPFQGLEKDHLLQAEEEFPHPHTNNRKFMETYFHVTPE